MGITTDLKATGVADVMVILRPENEALAKVSTQTPSAIARHFIKSELSQDAEILAQLKSRQRHAETAPLAATTSAASLGVAKTTSKPVRFYPHLGIALGTVDRQGLAALRKEAAVERVVAAPALRLIRPVAVAPAKPAAGYSWGLKRLKIDVLHARYQLDGSGVLIGHLDTGVDGSHEALQGAIAAFAEFDALGNLVPDAPVVDTGDHGTHTAGTIAGRPVRGVQFGVAPGATLASATVIEGGHVIARILAGMNWAVGQKVRVLSMSLGLIGTAETFLALTRILRSKGVLPVFAVGNEGPGSSRYPGNYAEALSVGALDGNDLVADFSSSQHFVRKADAIVPDLVAPGVEIVSCAPGNDYQSMDGTSMATPHIAGLAALLMQAEPNATIDQIEAAIFASCRRGSMSEGRANRGCPDGVEALQALTKATATAALPKGQRRRAA